MLTTRHPGPYTKIELIAVTIPASVTAFPISIRVYLLIIFATMSMPPEEALTLKRIAWPNPATRIYATTSYTLFPVTEPDNGHITSKILRNTGSNIEVYTVFTPNSFPTKRNPITRSTTFSTIVSMDMEKPVSSSKTIARPDILPITTLLGIRKKYILADIMSIATVINAYSYNMSFFEIFFFAIFFI